MGKVINLDALIPESHTIILDGVEHAVEAASVEAYLRVLKTRGRLKNVSTEAEQVELAVEMIVVAVPTIQRERLMRLPIRALMAVAELVMDQMRDGEDDSDISDSGESAEGE